MLGCKKYFFISLVLIAYTCVPILFAEVPRSPGEFIKLAEEYDELAQYHVAIVKRHTEMVEAYKTEKQGGNATMPESDLDNLIEHCETIVRLANSSKEEMTNMAGLYRGLAQSTAD